VTNKNQIDTAHLGGGCFWCFETLYKSVPGVKSVTSGYAGGRTPNPSYEQVCTGATGHAEIVEITYDPARITYGKLLDLFWQAHDPTTLNRQGADAGTQYRSIILYRSEGEKAAAVESRRQAQASFKDPIVTEIVPLDVFYPAEAYHQDFYASNPAHPYNRAVIAPKLHKFTRQLLS
jgi:peptide-methionine (S)-S-oxide reductase